MTMVPATAGAGEPTTDVSVYVSDQFKTVAKRVFSQLTADVIANHSCPSGEPLCKPVAEAMAVAFSAALSKDPVAIEAALGDFFVNGSVASLLHTFGRVLPDKVDGSWIEGTAPLFQCVLARLSGKSSRRMCLAGDFADASKALLQKFEQEQGIVGPDKKAIDNVVQAVASQAPLDPSDALRTLAAIASSDLVQRPDVRVYLLALSDWVKEGLTDGIFPASYRYLAHLDTAIFTETSVVKARDGEAVGNFSFLTPHGTDDAKVSANACGKNAAAIDSWSQNYTAYFNTLRTNLLQGLPMDLTPFRAIQALGDCPDQAGKALRDLRRQLRYMQGSLEVEQARIKYGIAGLSAAALVDYVRTADENQLLRNLRAILVYGLARWKLYEKNKTLPALPATPAVKTVEDVLRSCEFQKLELDLGVPVSRDPAKSDQCSPIAGGPSEPAPGGPTAGALAAVRNAALTLVRTYLRAALDASPPASFLTDTQLVELGRAVALIQEDDTKGATRALIRFGVDLMVERVDAMVTKMLGPSDTACIADASSRSIFTGLGGPCALHLLIQGAYEPVADYFGNQGQTQTNPSQLAATVYKNLLATPYLDSTPVILNVGLGGNYIVGHQDVWGKDGSGALTVLDKVGLAFYKRNWQNFRFETGPFVGGFLDALVRSLDGQSQRSWLAGYTVGMPRMWGTDMGIELHAAAVMPFALNESHRYGVAFGGALVIPFNFVFEGGSP